MSTPADNIVLDEFPDLDSEIRIPNLWNPRPHQLRLWTAMEQGCKRAVAVWHRRAGKDNTAMNWTAVAAHHRIGTYWHMLPTATQGRMVAWEGQDLEGRRLIDQAFPPEIRVGQQDNNMRIELACGSIWRVVGSDNYDRLVGANPIGVVFSEWSLTDPRAWDYVRPILLQNGGWAMFIFTPRGKNHGFETYDIARHNKDWFCECLTVDDTRDEVGKAIISGADISAERSSGMSEALIQQEYYCSFEAANEGSYYGKQMERAEQENRIGVVPYQHELKVNTWWDLGIGDSTAIWFVQKAGGEYHVIDFYIAEGEGLAHYAKVLQEKGYVYGTHWAPHDIEARELGTGKSRLEVARSLGLEFKVAPRLSVEDGIEAVRNILPRCWFDAEKCRHGTKALKSYHRDFNERRQAYLPHPVHDWSSHPADAFRTGAVATRSEIGSSKSERERKRYTPGRRGSRSYMAK